MAHECVGFEADVECVDQGAKARRQRPGKLIVTKEQRSEFGAVTQRWRQRGGQAVVLGGKKLEICHIPDILGQGADEVVRKHKSGSEGRQQTHM